MYIYLLIIYKLLSQKISCETLENQKVNYNPKLFGNITYTVHYQQNLIN